jgi:hypothetical protein
MRRANEKDLRNLRAILEVRKTGDDARPST